MLLIIIPVFIRHLFVEIIFESGSERYYFSERLSHQRIIVNTLSAKGFLELGPFRHIVFSWIMEKDIQNIQDIRNNTQYQKIGEPFTPSRKKIHIKKPFKNSIVLKQFLLLGSNNSDSAVFGYVSFGEIEDHSLRATPSIKKFLV